ncbi:hypothetical protein F4780DRAFT_783085 [Xylariomycetidae sp. FL0641]|nr:hypothetical protein F4780DRAFT_783085 [Xylariomycetidae sp. FL0641]
MHSIILIPELLENILLCLDMRTLLVSAQRVCQHWHTLILGSPPLQKKLFFMPDDGDPDTFKPVFNPLLQEVFPRFFVRDSPWTQAFPHSAIPFMSSLVEPTASWRRMLVRQSPPVYRVQSSYRLFGDSTIEAYTSKSRIEYLSSGLRMDEFYATVTRLQPEFFSVALVWSKERCPPELRALDHSCHNLAEDRRHGSSPGDAASTCAGDEEKAASSDPLDGFSDLVLRASNGPESGRFAPRPPPNYRGFRVVSAVADRSKVLKTFADEAERVLQTWMTQTARIVCLGFAPLTMTLPTMGSSWIL